MEDVNNVLDIVKDDNFYGEVIILVDFIVDGMFLIYYFLLFFLGNNCLVCLVLLLQLFGYYKLVCQKFGVSLIQKIELLYLNFFDGFKVFGNRFFDI